MQRYMWFMHDVAPAQFSLEVHNHLNVTYSRKWIGRTAPVAWPPRSPDINPCDFFIWGHFKSLVYATPVNTPEDLIARIIVAEADIKSIPGIFERVRESFIRRCKLCNDVSQQLLL
ncbi:hypothetical protein AVEN_152923-1 [Araneus ventricosus]|uniref:Tc1-like transposase DDE domain-containing protein n=1 Tax=Araneus ventricosus TaxID=182803 RepID=A0A4Y2AFI1_ARAVE|nr:hypothetical protein AVEN_152923-1 [Araneus ventricosus]